MYHVQHFLGVVWFRDLNNQVNYNHETRFYTLQNQQLGFSLFPHKLIFQMYVLLLLPK